MAGRSSRVLVVGAGLAGLIAARRIADHGIEVVVLEARHRIGGRVWSHRLGNGEVVEMGGEWISTTQTRVLDLVSELGLPVVDTGMDFTSRDPVGGPAIPAGEHRRLGRALSGRIQELGRDTLERMTAEELIAGLDAETPAMTVLRSRLAGTSGAALDQVGAVEIGEEFGVGDSGSYVRVEDGNDRIAKLLARGLDARLKTPVTSIHQTEDGVEVVARNQVFHGGAVVVAVPLAVLRRLVFVPDLPSPMLDVLSALGMGAGAKVAIATVDEPSMFRRQDLDIPAWYWTGRAGDGSVRRALTGFAGTGSGVRVLVSQVRERLAQAAPGIELVGDPTVVDWTADVYAGGCYSVVPPGLRLSLPALTRPWGRVVLAGEHVNGSGTIEGAILSGMDAAGHVIDRNVF
jgi:monoamine oxidase